MHAPSLRDTGPEEAGQTQAQHPGGGGGGQDQAPGASGRQPEEGSFDPGLAASPPAASG